MNTCKSSKQIVTIIILILISSIIPITVNFGYKVQVIHNLMHIPAFAVYTVVFLQLFKNWRLPGWLWMISSVSVLLLIGIIQELIQFLIPGRWPSISDIYLNLIGIIMGIGFYFLVQKFKPFLIRRIVCK